MPRISPVAPPDLTTHFVPAADLPPPALTLHDHAQAMVKAAVEVAFTAGQLSEARLFRDRHTAGNDGGSPARVRMRAYVARLSRRFDLASKRLMRAGLAHQQQLAELNA